MPWHLRDGKTLRMGANPAWAPADWALFLALCRPTFVGRAIRSNGRRMGMSSMGGEVYAFSEMLGRMSILRGFYGHFTDLYSGMLGMEACESLFTHFKKNKVVAEKFPVRLFFGETAGGRIT